MNVAAWLRELGMERYVRAFEENDVDAQTLRLLTEGDLAEIGVGSVGHRRKLAAAIAALTAEPLATPAVAPPRVEAEQRPLSVLYCQMAGPAATSGSRLDPEERRLVIQGFHKTCTQVVVEYDGHVANFYGDCMLAYFGWPRAHEDDAERAVRAGLALMHRVQAVEAGVAMRARVGIATGPVVVGDLIDEGPAQEQSAVGVTPNLAARLLGLAAPGQVVIDELTQRLLAPSFPVQPLGRHALKGIAQPMAAYAVSGERPADSRFDARKGQDLAPMVGRDQELALLKERWALARTGEGQAVLLVGEAGIGKSRITRALLDDCGAQPHRQVRWQCSPYHMGSALWPLIQRLGRAAELAAADSNDAALDKLEALTGQINESTALYATLLGLNGDQRYGPLEMTPQMLRERTLELLVEQLLEMAGQQALLLVVEDAHWIDPTTLELIERCLERIPATRMLILITSRPDNQPALGAHPSVARLSLNRLSRASVEAIVARLGGNRLQAQTLAAIVAQTDGVPLFVEELTKAVLETGEAAIPASLHGSLMARLDRIPEVKEVAQIAACIGREFDQALVQAVAERPEAVGEALDKLVAAELVFRRGDRANPRFTFKHALVHEAAYESLLRDKRQRIHAGILEVLETRAEGTPPEILARHADGAKQTDKAIGYWQQAGNAALAKSAYVEAAGYLDSAVELIHAQAAGTDRRAQELDLQLRLGQAHIAARGFGAEATGKAFERANELLEADPGKASYGLRAQYGLWAWHISRAELRKALHLATKALAVAHADGNHEMLLGAHRMVGVSHMFIGDLARARDHFDRAMGLVACTSPGELNPLGMDSTVATLCNLAWVLNIQGLSEQGNKLVQQARSIGLALPQVNARALMHFYCAMRAACGRDRAALAAEVKALAELAAKHRLSMHEGNASCLHAWVVMETGQSAEEAVVAYERGIAALVAIGARLYTPFFKGGLARALAASGRHQQALRTIGQALTECEETAQGWCHAELWRVRGELVLSDPQPDHAAATRSFEQALAVARACGAKLWELRAAVSLARLWVDQGERARARALLAPIHDSFTEGFDTVDLRETKALLSELGQDLAGAPHRAAR
jgi:class 3 adenylate cyclase/tetratricopeptide (TPR) repeat protein